MLTILFVLTLASDMTVLYGNDAFSILVLSTKKRYSSFLKMAFVFQKTYFRVKYYKISKLPLIATQKNVGLSNGGLFQKSLVLFFR